MADGAGIGKFNFPIPAETCKLRGEGVDVGEGELMAEAATEKSGGSGQEGHLQPGLKRRHMTMISLGGIIGAGLFVGTGPILNQAGPATILTYLLTGALLILIMRMLGEMAVAQPSVGSFSDYGRMALGNWAGFSIGWLYWYFWAIVVGFEATVAASILGQYIPNVAPWVIALILVLLLTATNLYSVGSYGEFEFWFAGIKVVAILLFIGLGALFVIGLWPGGDSPGLTNLYADGGFFPNGPLVMFSGVATVIFAFVGAEIVTIAAAESNEPGRNVARATNAVIYRVLIFYVISVFFVAAIVPWNTPFTEDMHQEPVHPGVREDGDTRRGDVDELRGPDRGPLRPQLQPLYDLQDALRPNPPQRRALVHDQHYQAWRADLGDPHGDHLRLRLGRDLLLLSRRRSSRG